ncbi:hypothetical protein MVEN_00260300 [Mycena venus]|uniref:Uncharacterized protein n=1 Tax=Mycena venus TaxID=2733690 RepID=A0A8H6Z4W0_9AGAR|nr:hypothetical protein MVEN_00260300 [Mycena venus]
MKLAFFLAISSALTVRAATVVTLYGFQPNGYPENAVSLSVAGVGTDGATTYVEDIFQTAVVYGDSSTGTNTAPVAVQTLHATLVADASIYHYSMLPTTGPDGVEAFGVLETCTLDPGKGTGECVAQGWADGGETVTTTFTGQVAPFYTLTVGNDGAGGSSRNGAERFAGSVPALVLACAVPGLLAGFL